MKHVLSEQDRDFFRKCGSKGGKIGGSKNKAKGSEYFSKIRKGKKKLSTAKENNPVV